MKNKNNTNIFTPVLIGGSLILLISFAIRSTFGLFQIPIADEFLWARSEFSMAIAIQNLAWGIGTPIFSAFAEKFGDRKAITLGLILYAIGVFVSSSASSPEAHQFLNILIGFGIAGSGFGPILAVVGRTAAPDKRSLALGITTAAGSAGQVIGPPFAAGLLNIMPWSSVFIIFAIISILTISLVPLLKSEPIITKKEVCDLGSGFNIYGAKVFKNDYVYFIDNNMGFNYQNFLLMTYNRIKYKFIPMSWKSEGEKSNVRLINQTLMVLGIAFNFMLYKFDYFKKIKKNYLKHNKVIARSQIYEGIKIKNTHWKFRL